MAAPRAARRSGTSPAVPEDIVLRLRAGDPSALDELLQREWQRLVGYAERFTTSLDEAEDVAQRAFVRLWVARDRLDPERSIRAFLYRTARNITIDLQRRRDTRRDARAMLAQGRTASPTPYDRLRERELRGAVDHALEELSPRRREAFLLCRVHGLSHREAADAMDVSPQTIANHVTAALRAIRAAISPRLD